MPERTAVLVIDLQVGVLADCLGAVEVVERTAALVERARLEQVPVVWVQDHGSFDEADDEWALVPPLVRGPDEPLIRKAYRDAFAGTELVQVLEGLGITRLVVAGAQTDYCVRTTTQSAAVRGFDVVLVEDAHTTTDAEYDGVVISAAQIVAHTNMYFGGLRYPGHRYATATHHEVDLSPW